MRSPNSVRRSVPFVMLLFACLMLAGMRSASPESLRPSSPSASSAQFTPFKGWSSLGHPADHSLDYPIRGVNADGRQQLFALDAYGDVWSAWQQTPNGKWGSWFPLRSPSNFGASCLAIQSNPDGRMELFAKRSDGAVWHTWQGVPNGPFVVNQWGDVIWESFGRPNGVGLGCPVAGQYADGRMDLFSIGDDGNVWSMGQQLSGGWFSGWFYLGKPSGHSICCLAWQADSSGRQHIFALADDNRIFFDYDTAASGDAWSDWIGIGRPSQLTIGVYAPAIVWTDDYRIEVFAIGNDGNLWRKYQLEPSGSSWSPWWSSGAPASPPNRWWWYGSTPVVGRYYTSGLGYTIQVFAQDIDGDWWHGDGGGAWYSLGQPPGGAVIPTAFIPMRAAQGNNADGTLVFFAVGNDGAIWMNPQGAMVYLPLLKR